MRGISILALLGMALAAALPARAADCSLKMVNAIPLTLAQNGKRALVTVGINGNDRQFLLDTGGFLTMISAAATAELKLPVTEGYVRMLDMYGHASETEARVETLKLGRLQDRSTTIPIIPDTFAANAPFVGILAPDYMGKYDIELDFQGGKMNYFTPDHCPGQVVYWQAPAIAIVPITFRDHKLILPVTVDGHQIKAIIDTGAPNTTMNAAAAKRLFGLPAGDANDETVTDEDGNKTFLHIFDKLSFEGLEVGHPRIVVMPDMVGRKDPNNGYVTGSRVHREDDADPSDAEMLIGMNILSHLRLFIDFSENKLYITPAGAPPATTAAVH